MVAVVTHLPTGNSLLRTINLNDRSIDILAFGFARFLLSILNTAIIYQWCA